MTGALMPMADLRVRGVTCIPVEVPLRYVLGTSAAASSSTMAIDLAPLRR